MRLRELLQQTPQDAIAGSASLSAQAWRTSESAPSFTWARPQFEDDQWETSRAVRQNEQWWRQTFLLDRLPDEQPVVFIRNTGDFEVFLNGQPARQDAAGKLDQFQVVICDPSAQASLRVGRNVIAIHGTGLRPGEVLGVELAKVPRLSVASHDLSP